MPSAPLITMPPPKPAITPPIASIVWPRSAQSCMLSGDTAPRLRHAGLLPDHDEAIRLAERKRAKQRRVDERKEGAVGADAETPA